MAGWPKLKVAALRNRSFKVLPVRRAGYFRGRHGYFGRAAQKTAQQQTPTPKTESMGNIQDMALRWLAEEGFHEGADYSLELPEFTEGYGLNIRMRYPKPVVMSVEEEDAGSVLERIRVLSSGVAHVRLRPTDLKDRLDYTMKNAVVGLEVF